MESRIRSFNFNVLNLLSADYRSNLALLGASRALRSKSPAFGESSISANDDADQVDEWISSFWGGDPAFKTINLDSLDQRQKQILSRIFNCKESLNGLAEGLLEVFTKSNPSDDDLRSLAAAYVKYAGMRRSSLLGLSDYAIRTGKQNEYEYYRPIVSESNEDWDSACNLLHRAGGHLDATMRSVLTECSYAIPGAFRSYAHQANILLALLQGGPNFDNLEFKYSEADAWREHGYNAVQAGYWRAYDLSADEASSWTACGISEPVLAQGWKFHGFNPDDVTVWVNHDIAPLASSLWQRRGYSMADAKLVINE